MRTLRQHKARLIARARRQLSRFTNTGQVREAAEVSGPREALTGAGGPASLLGPREAVFVALPAGANERDLPVPTALTPGFRLPEPDAFGRVTRAGRVLENLPGA